MTANDYVHKQAQSAARMGGVSAVGTSAPPVLQRQSASKNLNLAKNPFAAKKVDPKNAYQRARLNEASERATTPEEKATIAAQKRELDIREAPISDGAKDEMRSMYEKAGPAKKEIDAVADKVAAQFGGSVAKAPLKGVARVVEKAQDAAEARGSKTVDAEDLSRIKDIARNTIVVPGADVDKALQVLLDTHKDETGKSLVPKFKSVKADEDALGYSGVNVTMATKAGTNAETQINSPEMIYAKEKPEVARGILGEEAYNRLKSKPGMPEGGLGHHFYEEHRVLDPKDPKAVAIADKSKAYYNSVRNPQAPDPAVAPTS